MQQILVHGSGGAALTNTQNAEVSLVLGDGQRLEEFEEHDRNSLACLKTVSRNTDVKHPTGEGSKKK